LENTVGQLARMSTEKQFLDRERVNQEKVRNVASSKDKQFFAIEVTKDAK
jgi:hypothetical protein